MGEYFGGLVSGLVKGIVTSTLSYPAGSSGSGIPPLEAALALNPISRYVMSDLTTLRQNLDGTGSVTTGNHVKIIRDSLGDSIQTGPITYDWNDANNLVFTETLSAGIWDRYHDIYVGVGIITDNIALAPNSEMTASMLAPSSVSGNLALGYPIPINGTYTFSVHVKRAGVDGNFYMWSVTLDGITIHYKTDLDTGIISLFATDVGKEGLVTTTTTNVGGGWWRVSFSFTGNATEIIQWVSNTSGGGFIPITSNFPECKLYWWGAQLEIGNTMTDYIPHRTEFKLGARRNLLYYTSEFAGLGWQHNVSVNGGPLTIDNVLTGPLGVQMALIHPDPGSTEGGYSNYASISQQLARGVPNLVNMTVSLYVKDDGARYFFINTSNGSTTPTGYFDLQLGTVMFFEHGAISANISDAGGGFYRVSITFKSQFYNYNVEGTPYAYITFGAAGQFGGNSYDPSARLYVGGVQYEQSDVPTTYEPHGRPLSNSDSLPFYRNLLYYTSSFSGIGWSHGQDNGFAIDNFAIGPDGSTMDAVKIYPDLTSLGKTAVVAPAQQFYNYSSYQDYHTFSMYVKAGTLSKCRLVHSDNTTSSAFCVNFDLITGTAYVISGQCRGDITNEGNGWWRVSITMGSFNNIDQFKYMALLALTNTYSPNLSSGDYLLVARAQYEMGAFATDYEAHGQFVLPPAQYDGVGNCAYLITGNAGTARTVLGENIVHPDYTYNYGIGYSGTGFRWPHAGLRGTFGTATEWGYESFTTAFHSEMFMGPYREMWVFDRVLDNNEKNILDIYLATIAGNATYHGRVINSYAYSVPTFNTSTSYGYATNPLNSLRFSFSDSQEIVDDGTHQYLEFADDTVTITVNFDGAVEEILFDGWDYGDVIAPIRNFKALCPTLKALVQTTTSFGSGNAFNGLTNSDMIVLECDSGRVYNSKSGLYNHGKIPNVSGLTGLNFSLYLGYNGWDDYEPGSLPPNSLYLTFAFCPYLSEQNIDDILTDCAAISAYTPGMIIHLVGTIHPSLSGMASKVIIESNGGTVIL